jgi:NAD(P)-dependent dehydrogenase (short-subunit alcohol dehydrogenase family)
VLVYNAGVLPDRRAPTADGLELALATNLVGPFLLTGLLLPALESAKGRVVLASSGGMYTQRLDVAALFAGGPGPYDGVVQYARTKRARVVLNELLAEKLAGSGVTVSAMHPGWADTAAVRASFPRFHALTKGILRAPEEGADTVVWLAASRAAEGRSELFWFDREAVGTTPIPGTREPEEERGRLWQALDAATGLDRAVPTAPRGSAPGRRRRRRGS